MKKALVFMLLALVAISGLFASGSSENSKSLVVWYERSFSDDANVVIEDRFKQYADENDVDLEYEMIVATIGRPKMLKIRAITNCTIKLHKTKYQKVGRSALP